MLVFKRTFWIEILSELDGLTDVASGAALATVAMAMMSSGSLIISSLCGK